MTSLIKVDTIQTSAGGVATASSLGIGGVGKIGQVISQPRSTEYTTTSTSFVATPLSVNITPTATSSKILIIASSNVANNNINDTNRYTIMRDSTVLDAGAGMANAYSNTAGDIRIGIAIHYLDSPNTTSQITYALGHRTGGTSTSTVNKNGYTGSITVMEILA